MVHVDSALIRRAQWSAAYADVLLPNPEVNLITPKVIKETDQVSVKQGPGKHRAGVRFDIELHILISN